MRKFTRVFLPFFFLNFLNVYDRWKLFRVFDFHPSPSPLYYDILSIMLKNE